MGSRGSVATRALRRLRLLGERFVYEVRRPDISDADIALRLIPDAAASLPAPEVFRALIEHHLRAAPAAPAWRDARRWDPPPREVDWHLDPHFGVRWPCRYAGAIPDVLPGTDVNLLWRRNKMMPLLDLAARGEADACYRLIDSWCRQNPWMVGKNWRSPMEIGTRLLVWSLALSMLRDAPPPEEAACARLVRSVIRQADCLAGHFAHREIPNNHLIGEAATLYAFAAYWPELRDATAWLAQAEGVLEAEARRQILDDGLDYENAINYHLYVVDFLLLYLHAKAIRGEAPPEAILDAAGRALDAVLALVSPAGRFPQVGDDSMTEFLALRSLDDIAVSGPVRARDLLRPGFASALEGTPWGRGLTALECPLESRRWFEDAGIAVFRRARSHATFVCGPQHDRPFSTGHLHLDAGSFELEVDGQAVFIDSGTWLYTYDAAARRHFRGAAAHNTVLAGGADPVANTRVFGWDVVPTARALGVGTDAGAAWVACERALGGGGVHRRVFTDLDGVWVVADEVTGAGERSMEALFHTPLVPGSVTLDGADRMSIALPNSGALAMDVVAEGGYEVTLLDDPADRRTAFSRAYGDLQHGVTVRTAARAPAPVWRVAHVIRHAGVTVAVEGWRGRTLALTGENGTRATVDLEAPEVHIGG